MKKIALFSCLISLWACAQQPVPSVESSAIPTMLVGQWGGERIGMDATQEEVSFALPCGRAQIVSRFSVKSDLSFSAKGTYTHIPGTIPMGMKLTEQPAVFEGTVQDSRLNLVITLETGEKKGTFLAYKNQAARVGPCQ
jgi:hypothetical protein